jgi:hypothetical protein
VDNVVGMAWMRIFSEFASGDLTGTDRFEELVYQYVDNVDFKYVVGMRAGLRSF